MKNNISTTTARKLLEIAKRNSYEINKRGDLQPRYRDDDDFFEMSVGGLEAILEQAYTLGIIEGRTPEGKKYSRADATILRRREFPIDRNDPVSALTAVEYSLPAAFSEKAQAVWRYLGGAAAIYEYKGRLVVTDESLELTDAGDGTHDNPLGGPRWTFDSWNELERMLEASYDDLAAEDLI